MIPINKGQPPTKLIEVYSFNKSLSTVDRISYKQITSSRELKEVSDEIKVALIKEQGGLCAYCQSELPVDPGFEIGNTKIPRRCTVEHIKSQAENLDLDINWQNLVACCHEQVVGWRTCNASKANVELSCLKSPLYCNVHEYFKYKLSLEKKTVKIKPIPNYPDSEEEVEVVLNLNDPKLIKLRFRAFFDLMERIRLANNKATELDKILAEIDYFSKDNLERKPYAGFLYSELKKAKYIRNLNSEVEVFFNAIKRHRIYV